MQTTKRNCSIKWKIFVFEFQVNSHNCAKACDLGYSMRLELKIFQTSPMIVLAFLDLLLLLLPIT